MKTPIAKTQAALKAKKEQLLDMPLPNFGLASVPLGPTMNMTVREGIEAAKDTVVRIVGKRDVGGERNKDADNRVDEIPSAFKQEEFASAYESRIKQTPAELNLKVSFEGARGESLCVLKPPPDPTLQKILNEAGVNGIEYKNGVPNFSPVAKAQIEIDYMLGGKGSKGKAARDYNFDQANEKLASQLNNSSELARQFGMESGGITAKDIEKYRVVNKLTWHELNDGVTMQLVPTEINAKFGHLGGVGEINAGAYEPGGFANK